MTIDYPINQSHNGIRKMNERERIWTIKRRKRADTKRCDKKLSFLFEDFAGKLIKSNKEQKYKGIHIYTYTSSIVSCPGS